MDGIKSVAMTTNGLTLERSLPKLAEAGLDAVNISLDTLHDKKFEFVSRRPAAGHARVMGAVDAVLRNHAEDIRLKVNCVVMRGMNDDELADFVGWTRDRALIVRFIEYMPFDGNKWNDKKVSLMRQNLSRKILILKLHFSDGALFRNGAEDTRQIPRISQGRS